MRRRLGATTMLILGLLVAACSQKAPQPPPPPSSYAKPPPAPATTGDTSPSASDQEHQDLLAVQQTYKDLFAEQNRLLAKGGSTKPTRTILATTSGGFRGIVMASLKSVRLKNEHMTVPARLVGVSMGPWAPTKVTFYGCEDFTRTKWVKVDGSTDTSRDPSMLRYVQRMTALKHGNRWQIDEVHTRFVDTFAGARCNGTWYS